MDSQTRISLPSLRGPGRFTVLPQLTRVLTDGIQRGPSFLLSGSVLLGDPLGFLTSTWSGRTNHLECSIEGCGGQILPFALCATCIKVKLKLHEFWDRVSTLKNV